MKDPTGGRKSDGQGNDDGMNPPFLDERRSPSADGERNTNIGFFCDNHPTSEESSGVRAAKGRHGNRRFEASAGGRKKGKHWRPGGKCCHVRQSATWYATSTAYGHVPWSSRSSIA
jgi:hypothetical protein